VNSFHSRCPFPFRMPTKPQYFGLSWPFTSVGPLGHTELLLVQLTLCRSKLTSSTNRIIYLTKKSPIIITFSIQRALYWTRSHLISAARTRQTMFDLKCTCVCNDWIYRVWFYLKGRDSIMRPLNAQCMCLVLLRDSQQVVSQQVVSPYWTHSLGLTSMNTETRNHTHTGMRRGGWETMTCLGLFPFLDSICTNK